VLTQSAAKRKRKRKGVVHTKVGWGGRKKENGGL
jgi:hypothetical protein